MSSSASYLDPVIMPLFVGESVLDAGCGLGRWAGLLRTNFWEAGLRQPPVVDGFDAFEPNVELCARTGTYRRVWRQELPSPLEGAWDTVLAAELIEHVAEEHVEEVVALLEHAARRRVIFSTPNFPAFRGGGDTIAGFNEWEAHRAYVPRSFFVKRGYRLLGAGFGNPRHPVVRALRPLRLATSLHSVPRRLPSLAETIVAFKDVA